MTPRNFVQYCVGTGSYKNNCPQLIYWSQAWPSLLGPPRPRCKNRSSTIDAVCWPVGMFPYPVKRLIFRSRYRRHMFSSFSEIGWCHSSSAGEPPDQFQSCADVLTRASRFCEIFVICRLIRYWNCLLVNVMLRISLLTHWGRVTHICVNKAGHHWFR